MEFILFIGGFGMGVGITTLFVLHLLRRAEEKVEAKFDSLKKELGQ